MTTEIPIDNGHPIPLAKSGKYPFDKLTRVGMSFFVKNKQTSDLSASRAHAQRRTGWKFTARYVTEDRDGGEQVTGTRVWRTE